MTLFRPSWKEKLEFLASNYSIYIYACIYLYHCGILVLERTFV